ncbi:hypothetical protein ABBQ38_001455 [Trebouxia sp. C0009 RCD-2024]
MWARVFSYLQPTPHNFMESPCIFIGRPDLEAQRRFFRLPLVCRRFRNVFNGHVELPRILVVQQNLSLPAWSGMKTWLQRHAAHLQSITSLCAIDETIEEVLALLAMYQSCLTSASVVINSSRQLAALGCLRHLTACTLQSRGHKRYPVQWLDVTPLQDLPSLRSLVLKNGCFSWTSPVVDLLSLSIFQCQIRLCSLAMPLQKLFISESSIDGLGSRELSTCHSLEHLTLINCSAFSLADPYTGRQSLISTDLSELTGLKTLRLDFPAGQRKSLTMDWLYHLVHLEKLKLVHGSNLILSEGMGALCRLVSLSVDSTQRQPQDNLRSSVPHTLFRFDWRKLRALRHVEVSGDYVVDLRLLDLLTLKHLQHITFEGHPLNRSSVSAFSIFMYRLAALRSDVHVEVHGAVDLLSDNMETIWDQYDANPSHP